jgi:hypothetical protein
MENELVLSIILVPAILLFVFLFKSCLSWVKIEDAYREVVYKKSIPPIHNFNYIAVMTILVFSFIAILFLTIYETYLINKILSSLS